MRWIDQYGDRDRDGFQEYETRSTHGYYNQGWKDAGDAIPHADGTLAAAADRPVRAPGLRLRRQAPDGRRSTDSSAGRATRAGCGARPASCTTGSTTTFWWEAEGTYYLGLDGKQAADPVAWRRTPATCSRRASSRRSGPAGSSRG